MVHVIIFFFIRGTQLKWKTCWGKQTIHHQNIGDLPQSDEILPLPLAFEQLVFCLIYLKK